MDQRHRHRPARSLAHPRNAGWAHEGPVPPELRGPGRAGRGRDGATVGAPGAWEHQARPRAPPGRSGRREVGERAGTRVDRIRHARAGEHQGAGRSRHRAADPAGHAGAGGTDDPALGAQPGGRLHRRGPAHSARSGDHRRARHAHVPGGRPALQRAGARSLGPRGQGGRWRGHHVPQPPRLRGGHGGGGQAGRQCALPEHRVCGPAAHGGRQAREAGGADLRRGVRRPARGGRQAAQAIRRLARHRGARRPDPGRAHRWIVRGGSRAAVRDGARDHPDLRDHRHAQGRQPVVAGRRWTRRCRCSRRSR